MKPNIITYFPLAVAIIGIAVTWGVFTAKLSAQGIRLDNVETREQKIDDTLTDLRVKVSEIDANVKFIKERIQ